MRKLFDSNCQEVLSVIGKFILITFFCNATFPFLSISNLSFIVSETAHSLLPFRSIATVCFWYGLYSVATEPFSTRILLKSVALIIKYLYPVVFAVTVALVLSFFTPLYATTMSFSACGKLLTHAILYLSCVIFVDTVTYVLSCTSIANPLLPVTFPHNVYIIV